MSRYPYASFPVPFWITKTMTYLSVWWEALFPFLVMSRHLRLPALAFGVLFHLGIFITIAIGWFGFCTLCLYGVWIPEKF